jgi:phosphoglycolate phosphatase-like HAD superfamily hydrolase
MKDMVIFDLDGTLALIDHRLHFLEGKKKNWRKFFAACVDDLPNEPVIEVLRGLRKQGYSIWITSGRSDEVRSETVAWLQKYAIPYDELLMRSQGDLTADHTLKQGWLKNGTLQKDRVLMVFDDRDKVVAMWRAQGLVCAQVAPGDF